MRHNAGESGSNRAKKVCDDPGAGESRGKDIMNSNSFLILVFSRKKVESAKEGPPCLISKVVFH